ncbi:unnamed protein product [Lactuca saligna]|uniref:Uncharacterized protein n=1 Tax=Lactuca saligna TaxID=75948 RepID=A0AA35YDL8_LACSI|nr:unnamed protein product [Lactuca saligna]
MQKCIEKPYVVESSDSEEDDENDDDIEADDVAQRGSTLPFMENVEPIIQDENSPKPMSPAPQAKTVPSMPNPIMNADIHQDNQEESNSNF